MQFIKLLLIKYTSFLVASAPCAATSLWGGKFKDKDTVGYSPVKETVISHHGAVNKDTFTFWQGIEAWPGFWQKGYEVNTLAIFLKII